jgi:nucleotide-binding universal stress UspA family protein
MNIKTIGVALVSAESAEWLAAAASGLARGCDAHLIGVHAAEPIVPYLTATAFEPVIVPEFLDWQVEEAEAIRKAFEAALAREGVAGEYRGQDSGAVGAEDFLVDGLRAADLVIAARLDRDGRSDAGRRLHEQVIRNSGRPVLVLPRQLALAGPARTLVIGISPTREATRAAHDALMLAAPGAAIHLVSVTQDSQPGRVAFDLRHDLAAAFDRLGYAVTLVDRDGGAGDAGAVLLAVAAGLGADLVATGAFGHSRAYDFVVGAATAHLLEHAELPVLFSK